MAIHRRRKGMVIKNPDPLKRSVTLHTRELVLNPGQQTPITAEEVMDPALRDLLQTRKLAIVRPNTEHEEGELRKLLGIEDQRPWPRSRQRSRYRSRTR